MDKHLFYEGKSIVSVEWWISYGSEFPELYWARLRVFSDGSSDAAFDEFTAYGFDTREYASYFLSSDEYISFNSVDEQDEIDIGAKKSQMSIPVWSDDQTKVEFEYLGTY